MATSGPALSVIIPFYDETAFLGMAVRSVLSQGVAGIEVIVVNDNPARFGVAELAALNLPDGVQILHHPHNLGLSSARNTGLAAAQGAWIGFLDADDYYLNDGLAAQLRLAQSSQADIVQANCLLTRHGLPDHQPLDRETALFPKPASGAGLIALEEAQFITSSWSSLYRRPFLEAEGLRFDPAQVKFEDRLFVLQTVTAARKIAVLGQANRVWRRRTGSISVSGADATVLRLQVQLLEKCLAHMQAWNGPQRFLKREAFNTVSRLIWDIDLIPALAGDPAPEIADLGPRIAALMQECMLGQQIFDDAVVRKISRVGMKTRKGNYRRVDVFAVAKALREADFPQAAALVAARKPAAAPATTRARPADGPRLVLHLGLHKTGSTALQTLMATHRDDLRRAGVLFPETGLATGHAPVRDQGNPGHLGLLEAVRRSNDLIWRELRREVQAAACDTVVISCENMALPVDPDRDDVVAALMARLGQFRSVDLVAFVRRPDHWPEMFFRELVANGNRLGARSLAEFLVDYAPILTDLPRLFAPYEAATGAPVRLIDHDASSRDGAHWRNFVRAAGLPAALADLDRGDMPRLYRSPALDEVLAAQLLTTLVANPAHRIRALRGFFAGLNGRRGAQGPLLAPADRIALIDDFAARSADFAAARGYAPDLAALRTAVQAEDWRPAPALTTDLIRQVTEALARTAQGDAPASYPPLTSDGPPRRHPVADRDVVMSIRLRPWLRRLLALTGLRR